MTLGDKLQLLRKQNGWSQETLAEKLNISRQSVSKWESNTSTPDLDKIIKLSELFGISIDSLLKEEQEIPQNTMSINMEETEQLADKKTLSTTEIEDYIALTLETSKKLAFGVSLCILSPVTLLALYGFVPQTLSESYAGGIGCSILLLLVAAGVFLLITNGIRLGKYNYLEQETFTIDPSTINSIEKKHEDFGHTFRRRVAFGVALCIIGVIPLLLSGAFTNEDRIHIWCLCLLLILIACSVFQFIWAGSIYGCYEKLLQIGDYTPENKEIGNQISWFPGAYWCLTTAIYLGISFYFDNWDFSWIIWPVAGVLFAALYQILRSMAKAKLEQK